MFYFYNSYIFLSYFQIMFSYSLPIQYFLIKNPLNICIVSLKFEVGHTCTTCFQNKFTWLEHKSSHSTKNDQGTDGFCCQPKTHEKLWKILPLPSLPLAWSRAIEGKLKPPALLKNSERHHFSASTCEKGSKAKPVQGHNGWTFFLKLLILGTCSFTIYSSNGSYLSWSRLASYWQGTT